MAERIIKNKLFIFWSLAVLLHVVLLLKINFFPYPELFIYPYLTKIGLIPYKQIFDQHFPAFLFLPVNFATLGIDTPQEFRIVQLLLVVFTQSGLFLVSRKVFKEKYFVVATAILYLVWQSYFEGNTLWIESMLTPILLFGFLKLLLASESKSRKEFFLSGLILGIALSGKQVVLPLIALVSIYLFFKQSRKNLFAWILGLLVPMFLVAVFVYARGIENEFIYWAGIFNLTAYHDMGRKFATSREALSTMFIAFPAILSVVFLYKRAQVRNTLIFLSIFFVTGFVYAYARFDYVHLQPVIPFAILLTLFGVSKSNHKKLLVVLYLSFSLFVCARFFYRNVGSEVKFFDKGDYAIFNEVSRLTKPGQPIFSFATYPHIYAMTNTRPSGNVFVFQFPWFMKITEEKILNGLIAEPPVLVIRDETATTDNYNLVSYMPSISMYIEKYYKVKETIGTTEILIPR